MPTLKFDFTNVGTEMEVIPPGVYEAEITGVPEVQPSKDGNSQNLIVVLTLQNAYKFSGRKVYDYLNLREEFLWRVNQLRLSAGIDAGEEGFDTEDLAGKIVKVELKNAAYTPPGSDEKQIRTNVNKYLFKKS